MEARLHNEGYHYMAPNTFYALTYQEIRRVLHGRNVLEEQKGGGSPDKKVGGRKASRPTQQDRSVHEEFKEKHNLKS